MKHRASTKPELEKHYFPEMIPWYKVRELGESLFNAIVGNSLAFCHPLYSPSSEHCKPWKYWKKRDVIREVVFELRSFGSGSTSTNTSEDDRRNHYSTFESAVCDCLSTSLEELKCSLMMIRLDDDSYYDPFTLKERAESIKKHVHSACRILSANVDFYSNGEAGGSPLLIAFHGTLDRMVDEWYADTSSAYSVHIITLVSQKIPRDLFWSVMRHSMIRGELVDEHRLGELRDQIRQNKDEWKHWPFEVPERIESLSDENDDEEPEEVKYDVSDILDVPDILREDGSIFTHDDRHFSFTLTPALISMYFWGWQKKQDAQQMDARPSNGLELAVAILLAFHPEFGGDYEFAPGCLMLWDKLVSTGIPKELVMRVHESAGSSRDWARIVRSLHKLFPPV